MALRHPRDYDREQRDPQREQREQREPQRDHHPGREPPRMHEYFIEREGINREVIQADICRYLGNDALVRPGTHQGRQGYFIRAYRNLTTEMIADLKADSIRWEAERLRREQLGDSRATYYDSAIHESRQQTGPTQREPFPTGGPPQYTEPYTATHAYGTGPASQPYGQFPSQPYGQPAHGNPGQTQYTPQGQTGAESQYMYTNTGPAYTYNERPRMYDNEPEYPATTYASAYPPSTYPTTTGAMTYTTTTAPTIDASRFRGTAYQDPSQPADRQTQRRDQHTRR